MSANTVKNNSFLSGVLSSGVVSAIFSYMYIALIFMAIVISLTVPVERGIAYFKFLMSFFGILLLLTMAGIISYLVEDGLFPETLKYNKDLDKFVKDGSQYFSILVFAGIIMCMVFLIPLLLRPLDFLMNFKNYIIGLCSYLFMMPTFINIM
jgi:hypothetical protein